MFVVVVVFQDGERKTFWLLVWVQVDWSARMAYGGVARARISAVAYLARYLLRNSINNNGGATLWTATSWRATARK